LENTRIKNTQIKHNPQKQTTMQNTAKQNYPGLVSFYDTRPGNDYKKYKNKKENGQKCCVITKHCAVS